MLTKTKLIEQIEIGLQQSANNQIISEEEMDKEIKSWFE